MPWLRSHRVLLAVYAGVIALAWFELTDSEVQAGRPDKPEIFLAPGSNIADVSAAVYPNRAMTLYYKAQQAALCSQPDAAATPVCRARGPVRPGEIRELLAQAVATGNRSIEDLLYNYAWVLLQEGASEAEVDAAVRNWRTSHPTSDRPDPRVAYRDLLERRVQAPQ
jgi:hypothetical protein